MDSVNLTSKRPDGSTITQNFSNINPSAAESDVALFMAHVANLSDNTLKNIEKVTAEDIDLSARVSIALDTAEYTNLLDNASIKSSRKNSNITNLANDVRIFSSIGADTLVNSGDKVILNSGHGNDSIYNSGSNVSISGGAGHDSISNSGDNVSISGGDGNDPLFNSGDSVTILGGKGNDTIINSGDNVSINGGYGDDTISNSGDNVSISSFYGDDTISNSGDNVSINGGPGNDTISNSGDSVTIDGGDGNNSVYIVANDSGVTKGVAVFAALGSDFIDLSSDTILSGSQTICGAHLIKYSPPGSSPTVVGFNDNDSIQLSKYFAPSLLSGSFDNLNNSFVITYIPNSKSATFKFRDSDSHAVKIFDYMGVDITASIKGGD